MNILIEKNIMAPMRDGVRLATYVYRPAEGGPTPVLLSRMSYNKELPVGRLRRKRRRILCRQSTASIMTARTPRI